jgi:hypothetical protein
LTLLIHDGRRWNVNLEFPFLAQASSGWVLGAFD